MTTSKKSKLFTLIISALSVIAVLVSALFLAFPKKPLTADNKYITISKVNRWVENDGSGKPSVENKTYTLTGYPDATYKEYQYIDYKSLVPGDDPDTPNVNEQQEAFKNLGIESVYYNGENHYYTHVRDYMGGDFVMLNNTNLEKEKVMAYNLGTKTYTDEQNFFNMENLLINFESPAKNLTFTITSVTLTLNGQKLYTGSEYDYDYKDRKDQKYAFLIDLHNLYKLAPNSKNQKGEYLPYEQAQGKLTVSIQYNLVVNNETIQEPVVDEISVYLINEEQYISSLTGVYEKITITSYEQLTSETLLNYINNADSSNWEDYLTANNITTNDTDSKVYKYTVGTDGGKYIVYNNGSDIAISDLEPTQNPFTTFEDFFTDIAYVANDRYSYDIYGYNKINATVAQVVENKLYENSAYYYYLKADNTFVKIDNTFTYTLKTGSVNEYELKYNGLVIDSGAIAYVIGSSNIGDLYSTYNYLEYYNNNNFEYHVYQKGADGYYNLIDGADTFVKYETSRPQKDIFLLNLTKLGKNSDINTNSNKGDYLYYTQNNDGETSYEYIKVGTDSIDNFYIQVANKEHIFESINTNRLMEARPTTANVADIKLYTRDDTNGTYHYDTSKTLENLYNTFEENYYVSILDLAGNQNTTYKNRTYYVGNFEKYLESINNIAGGYNYDQEEYFKSFLITAGSPATTTFNSSKLLENPNTSIYYYDILNDKFEVFKENTLDSFFVALDEKEDIVSYNNSKPGLFVGSTQTINETNIKNSKIKIFTKTGDPSVYTVSTITGDAFLNIYKNLSDASMYDQAADITNEDTFNNAEKSKLYIKNGENFVKVDESATFTGTVYYRYMGSIYYYCILDNNLRDSLQKIYFIGTNNAKEKEQDLTNNSKNTLKINNLRIQNLLFHSAIENSNDYFASNLQIGNKTGGQQYKFYKSVLDSNNLYYQYDKLALIDDTGKPLSDAFNAYDVMLDIYNANNKLIESDASYTLPILINTEKTYYNTNSTNTEVNYFSYNNTNTTDYFGRKSGLSTLQYPTYVYDATKYNLSYTYAVNNEVLDTVTTSVANINGNNVLTIKHNHKINGAYEEKQELPTNNIAKLTFSDIGTYNFTTKLVINVGNNTYLIDENNTALEDQYKYLHPTKLYIYGYQLLYTNYAKADSEGNTTLSEFKGKDSSADISVSVDKIISDMKKVDNYTDLGELTEEVNKLIKQYGSNLTFYYIYDETIKDAPIDTPNKNTKYIEVPIFKELSDELYYKLSPALSERVFEVVDAGKNFLEIQYNTTLTGTGYKKIQFDEIKNNKENYYVRTTNTAGQNIFERFDTLSTGDTIHEVLYNTLDSAPNDDMKDITSSLYYLNGNDYIKAENGSSANNINSNLNLITAQERTDFLEEVTPTDELADLSELTFSDLGAWYKLGEDTEITNATNLKDALSVGITNSSSTQTLENFLTTNHVGSYSFNKPTSFAIGNLYEKDATQEKYTYIENKSSINIDSNYYLLKSDDNTVATAGTFNDISATNTPASVLTFENLLEDVALFYHNGTAHVQLTKDNWTSADKTNIYYLDASGNYETLSKLSDIDSQLYYYNETAGKYEDKNLAGLTLTDKLLQNVSANEFFEGLNYYLLTSYTLSYAWSSSPTLYKKDTTSGEVYTKVETLSELNTYKIHKETNNSAEFKNDINITSLNLTDYITTSKTIEVAFNANYLFDFALNGKKFFTLDSYIVYNLTDCSTILDNLINGTTTYITTTTINNGYLTSFNSTDNTYSFATSIETGSTYYIFSTYATDTLWYLNGDIYTKGVPTTPFNGLATTNNLDESPDYEGFFYKDGNNYNYINVYLSGEIDTTKTYCELKISNENIIVSTDDGATFYDRTHTAVMDNPFDGTYYLLNSQNKKIYTAEKINDNGILKFKYFDQSDKSFDEDLQYYFPTSIETANKDSYYAETSSNIINYIYKFDESESKFKQKTDYEGGQGYYYNYLAYLCDYLPGTSTLPKSLYYTIKNNLEESTNNTTGFNDANYTDLQVNIRNVLKVAVKENNLNKTDNIVTTNQAPLSANFFANLKYGSTSGNDGYVYLYSFVDYFENKSDFEGYTNPKTSVFTNSTTFKENGYYVVYMIYSFENYSYYDGINLITSAEGARNSLSVQTFAFEIKKSQPNISAFDKGITILEDTGFADLISANKVYTYDVASKKYSLVTDNSTVFEADKFFTLNTLSSGAFTNQPITIKYNEDASEFNIEPYIKVTTINTNTSKTGSIIYTKKSLYDSLSDSIQQSATFVEDTDFEITLDTDNNTYTKYKVEIFYGANWTSSTTRYYTIDKQDIEDPTANQVKITTDADGKNIYTLKNKSLKTKFTTAYYDEFGILRTDGFALNWAQKPSGSEITATYKFIKLEEENNLQNIAVRYELDGTNYKPKFYYYSLDGSGNVQLESPINDLDSLYLNNGYTLKTISENLDYTQTGYYLNNGIVNISDGGVLPQDNINSVLNDSGIYIFTLKDSAGNEKTHVVFLDNSAPTILYTGISTTESKLINIADESSDGIISEDMLVFWAQGKEIPVNLDSITYSKVTSTLDFSKTTYYIENSGVYTTISETEYTEYIDAGTTPDIYTIIILDSELTALNTYLNHTSSIKTEVKDVKWKFEHLSKADLNKETQTIEDFENGYKIYDLNHKTGDLYDFEGYHTFTVYYELEKTDISYNTKNMHVADPTFELMLNTDNSKLTIYTVSDTENYNPQSYINLKQNDATNRAGALLTWQDSTDGINYVINSVKYSYFAFTFDKNSVNYPFSTVSEDIYLYQKGATNKLVEISGNKITTSILNESNNKTLEGVYIITRKYESLPNNSHDTLERTYYFYVDRYGIIENIEIDDRGENQPSLIGEFINILLSASTADKSALGSILGEDIKGDSYTISQKPTDENKKAEPNINTQKEYFVSTNKLPLFAVILDNKYLNSNEKLNDLVDYLNNITEENLTKSEEFNVLGLNLYYKNSADSYSKIKSFKEGKIYLENNNVFDYNSSKLYLLVNTSANPIKDTDVVAFTTININQNLNGSILYSYDDNGTKKYTYLTGYNLIDAFKINYQLFKYNKNSSTWEEVLGGLSNNINSAGTYKLTIEDTSGYTYKKGALLLNSNKEATLLNFYFTINTDKPNASFVKVTESNETTNYQKLSTSNNTSTTNSKNVQIVWKNSTKYMAQIDENNWTIVFNAANGDYVEFVYKDSKLSLKNNTISKLASVNDLNGLYKKLFNIIDHTSEPDWTQDWHNSLTLFKQDNTNNVFDLSYYKENQIDVDITITLQFEGEEKYFVDENGESFFKNIYTLKLDYTAPTQIYESLKKNDPYFQSLNAEQQKNFENFNSLISFDNYAFITNIKTNDTQGKITLSSSLDKSRAIYYREYSKYSHSDSYLGLQSLVENDKRFDDKTIETARIRYVEGTTAERVNFITAEKSTANEFTLNVSANSYYEVIEIDQAGNYRVYSIFVINNDNEFQVGTSYSGATPSLTIGGKNATNGTLEISTADPGFVFNGITQISDTNDWFDITVEDRSLSVVKTYNLSYMPVNTNNLTPYKENVEYFNDVNLLTKRLSEICKYKDTNKGNSYFISVYTGVGNGSINLSFKGESLNFESMFTKTNNSITLTIDKTKTITYLTSITISKYKDSALVDTAYITISPNNTGKLFAEEDSTKTPNNTTKFVEILNDNEQFIYIVIRSAEDGSYWFDAKDNFSTNYSSEQLIGIDNISEYTISGKGKEFIQTIEENNYSYKVIRVYYTGTVTYKCEPKIYEATFYESTLTSKLVGGKNVYSFKDSEKTENSNAYVNGSTIYTAQENAHLLVEVKNNKKNTAYIYAFIPYLVAHEVNLTSSSESVYTDLMNSAKNASDYQITSKFITINLNNNNYLDINGVLIDNTEDSDTSIYDQDKNQKIIGTETNKTKLATFDYLYDASNKLLTSINGANVIETFVEITYTNPDGITTTYAAKHGDKLDKCGLYDIKVYNSLGFTYATYKINLIETVNSYYNVISNNKVLTGFSYNPSSKLTTDSTDKGIYTIYYSSSSIYNIEVNSDSSKGIVFEEVVSSSIVTSTGEPIYKVYKLYSTKNINSGSLPLFFIVAIVEHTNTYHAETISYALFNNINEEPAYTEIIEDGSIKANIPTHNNFVKLKINSVYKPNNNDIFSKNYINIDYYFNDNFVGTLNYLTKGINGFDVNNDGNYYITLNESGIYKFKITDQTGRISYFGESEFLTVSLENNILFNINGETPIENAVFNAPVNLTLLNTTVYNTLTVNLTATLNNKSYAYKVDNTTNTYTFSSFGVYSITMTYKLDTTTTITTTYTFTILNPKEATHTFTYLAPNGYEILKVEKLQGENYSDVSSFYSNTALELTYDTNTIINNYNGAGRYKITVLKHSTGLAPETSFTFDVWINSAAPYVKVNVKNGATTRKEITITVDINSLYKELGECIIFVDGKEDKTVEVNEELIKANTNADGKVKNLVITITESGSYVAKIYTNSGNTLFVYNFTKQNSLNTMAIILIIVAVVVVGIVVFLFFKLRKNMTVR